MEYKHPLPDVEAAAAAVRPRIIIHGGAGNITRASLSKDRYEQYRHDLLSIVSQTNEYMNTRRSESSKDTGRKVYPTALEVATYAVTKLENNPLFNSGHGAVFTRDGINELEASVMVSRGFAKRGVGVTGLRRVKNPILLAKAMLEHGNDDLRGNGDLGWSTRAGSGDPTTEQLDVPSAQGHTLIHGQTAEILASNRYGLEMVDPSYFFTQRRWDEHVEALEREKKGKATVATWSAEGYLPQGTCGAVAVDREGVICVATSTGGMTNKLTGRIGDTPIVGAGFWAEEWTEEKGDSGGTSRSSGRLSSSPQGVWTHWRHVLGTSGAEAVVELSSSLRSLITDCLPMPFIYEPINPTRNSRITITRSTALSGTGNGDSFMRLAATRTVASIARWGNVPTSEALKRVAGRGGELEKSAGDRWSKTGEGESGMIGIETSISRDPTGRVTAVNSEILHDHNCAGMFRAWIDDEGNAKMRIWHPDED